MLNAIMDLFDKNVRLMIDRQIKDKNITENKNKPTKQKVF
jgi:hypothetical protein